MPVPLFDTSSPLKALRPEIEAVIARVLDRERYILGPEVAAFEEEFAAYCGVRHALGVANGTDALTIALRAIGVGPGDDVVVPSFTFYASAEAIPATAARPVFCDIDLDTLCITAETVKAALTPRTKAVVAVDLFGNLAPVAEIEALGVPVLEDAAHAAGTTSRSGRAGSLGPPRRSRSSRPRTSTASATAARSSPQTTRSPSGPGCCAFTAHSTRSRSSRWGTTRVWTICRRRSWWSFPTSTSGPPAAGLPARAARLPATDEAARTHLAIPMSPVLTADQAQAVSAVARRQFGRVAA